MEKIFDNNSTISDHLMIARAGSELALSYNDYTLVKRGMSKCVLSLVDCDSVNNIQAETQPKIESLNDSFLSPNMCQIVSIKALQLNKELRRQSLVYANVEEISDVSNLETAIKIVAGQIEFEGIDNQENEVPERNNLLEYENIQDTKISEATKLADQLRGLNPNARFNIKTDDLGERVISSIDIEMFRLPSDYQFNQDLNIEVKKTSTIDVFYSDDLVMDEKYLQNVYSEKIDLPAVEDIDFIGYEVAKSDEQIAQINSVIREMNIERVKRGLEERYIDHRFVHIIKEGAWKRARPGEAGSYEILGQCIYMPETKNKIVPLVVLNHEVGHAGDCNSIIAEGGRQDTLQTGLEITKGYGAGRQPHFRSVNEAVRQLSTLFTSERMLINDPTYKDELAEAIKIRNEWLKDDGELNAKNEFLKDKDLFEGAENLFALAEKDHSIAMVIYGNLPERKTFNKMTSMLSEYSGQSKDSIFEMFVDVAKVNDNSKITNLMERSLGKGAFEKLGKKSMTPKSFKKFVGRMPLMKKVNDIKEFAHNAVDKILGMFKKKNIA